MCSLLLQQNKWEQTVLQLITGAKSYNLKRVQIRNLVNRDVTLVHRWSLVPFLFKLVV